MTIHLALTESTRDAVYRFRAERAGPQSIDGLIQVRADAVGLQDHLDPTATLVVANDQATGRILGSVRSHVIGRGAIPLYAELHRLGALGRVDLNRCTVSSCWTLAPGADFSRNADVPRRLAWKLFELALQDQFCHDFLDCPDERVPFFLRLGYRPVRHLYHGPDKRTNLLRLDVYDWPYLARIRSPFLELAKEGAS